MYFVTTKGTALSVTSPLPLTAADALGLVERANRSGLTATVADAEGNPVTVEQLRKAAEG